MFSLSTRTTFTHMATELYPKRGRSLLEPRSQGADIYFV